MPFPSHPSQLIRKQYLYARFRKTGKRLLHIIALLLCLWPMQGYAQEGRGEVNILLDWPVLVLVVFLLLALGGMLYWWAKFGKVGKGTEATLRRELDTLQEEYDLLAEEMEYMQGNIKLLTYNFSIPINRILGLVSRLESEGKVKASQQEKLEEIKQVLAEAEKFVSRYFSVYQAQQPENIEMTEVALAELLRSLGPVLQQPGKIRISGEALSLRTDAFCLRNIFAPIITYLSSQTPEGRQVSITYGQAEEQAEVRITGGPQLSKEDVNKLFAIYLRTEPSEDPRLGFFNQEYFQVMRLVNILDGKLQMQPLETGIEFRIVLPLQHSGGGSPANTWQNQAISDEELAADYAALGRLMKEEKLYKDPGLNLKTLAERMEVHPRQMSYLVNQFAGMNVQHFINTYRVDYARELLHREDMQQYTLESIGEMVGFNSRSTFFATFKKIAGMTPKDYQKGEG